MSAPFREVSNALIALLEADGLLVGDGEKPDGAGWAGAPDQSVFVAYVVVHPILGGVSQGSMDDDNDHQLVYQLSCYGRNREAAEVLSSRVHPLVKDGKATITAALTSDVVHHIDDDVLGGARRIDEVDTPFWVAVPRYRIFTTPAS